MKVDKIELDNYKLFNHLCLNVEGENLHITGNAGQGKTTVISALWELMEMVAEPIKNGEEKGRIKITLSDGKKKVFAERRFTQKNKSINIVDSEGNKVTAAEFKEWFSSLADNPQDLLKLKPTEQLAALVQCVKFPAGFDLAKLDSDLVEAEATRSDAGRDIKRAELALGAEPAKVEKLDAVAAVQHVEQQKALSLQYDQTAANLQRSDKRLGEINLEIQKLQEEKAKLEAWKPGAEKWMLDTEFNVEAAQEKVNNLTAHNQKAELWADWAKKSAELDGFKRAHDTADKMVAELRTSKKAGLEAAEWPLQGLGIHEGEIYFNGVPFSQAGDSQKMLVCGVLAAEQIKTKEIKVVRMDGVESMSAQDFKFLEGVFNKNGIQVLSTRVARGSAEAGELVIHEGALV